MGNGAAALGLKGAVDKETFVKALEGHLPGGIEIAYKSDGSHRPGIDTTYSAPKSLSVIYAATTDPRVRDVILAAQASSVAKTQAWSEQSQTFARKGKGGNEHELTNSLITAAFCHIEVRPVGGVTESGIHTHGVRINATQRADGKWVAANWGVSEDWIKLEGAIYRSHLALDYQRGMAEIGYTIEIVPELMESGDMGFQSGGFTREEIEGASPRSGAIKKEIGKDGKTRSTATTAEKQAANYRTREAKSSLTPEELRAEWRERHGEAVDRVLAQARDRAPVAHVDAAQAAAMAATSAVQSAIRHFSERQSAYASSTLASYAVAHTVGKATVEDVLAAIQREVDAGRLVAAIPDPKAQEQRFTTQAAVARETTFIQRIERGIGAVEPINANPVLAAYLGEAQAAAVQHALTSPDRFTAWQGQAGAGKTTAARSVVVDVLREVRAASEEHGSRVVGIGPTHRAKNELRDAGVEDVRTVARMKVDARTGKLESNTVYLIDESSMISARDMAELVRMIERTDSRAILIGDTRQLQSVEAGNPFRQMQQHAATSVLDEIHRQKNERLLECVQAFARGDAKTGVMLAQPYMQTVPDSGDKVQGELREYGRSAAHHYLSLTPEEREKTLLITDTNHTRRNLNAYVRSELAQRGEISAENTGVRHLEKQDATKEQKRQATFYQEPPAKPGQEHANPYEPCRIVQFQRDYQSRGVSAPVEKGREYLVCEVKEKTVTLMDRESGEKVEWTPGLASRVEVSREFKEPIALCTGDHVIFKKNDRELGVTNGNHGTVIEAHKDHVKVRIEGMDKVVVIQASQGTHIEYGYAQTTHGVQGATCDRAIGAFDSASKTATANQGYVFLSRARQESAVYTNRVDRLSEKWQAFDNRETAREAAGMDPAPTQNKDTAQRSEESAGPTPPRGGEDFQRNR